MLRVLMRGTRGLATASATLAAPQPDSSSKSADMSEDDEPAASGLVKTARSCESSLKQQVKATLADAVTVPPQLLSVMNLVSMKTAAAASTKEDRKEKIDGREGDDDDVLEVGEDDELLDSPRHKKPRRDLIEEKHEEDKEEKKNEEESELHDKTTQMDTTASTTDDEGREGESMHSYISTLPPELVMRVLHYLPVKDLACAAQTCSVWYSLAQEDQIWRSLFNYARNQHFLECNPSERQVEGRIGSVGAEDGWKARFRDTYSVKRKFWFGSNEAFVHLDQTSFHCSEEDDDEEEFLTGEVILNIYSESITTNGLYLALVGEEAFKAIDAESLSMNATEEKNTLVEIYVPLSGNTEWAERKKNKHMFFRGTYHYPFRVSIPRKTIADRNLPPSFNRRVKTSSGFFRVSYHVCSVLVLSFPHSNMTSRRHPLRFRLSDRMENRLRTKVMNKYSAPVTDRLTHNSFNYLFFQKSGNVVFEVELQKQYFFINAEEMKIRVSVDNSQGRFPVHSITVALVEVLQERDNEFCREVVERRDSRRVYGDAEVQVAKGEVKRDIELYYAVTDANAKGGSLFNCGLFQQRFAVSVSLNIFGCVDPRIEIPLYVLRVPS